MRFWSLKLTVPHARSQPCSSESSAVESATPAPIQTALPSKARVSDGALYLSTMAAIQRAEQRLGPTLSQKKASRSALDPPGTRRPSSSDLAQPKPLPSDGAPPLQLKTGFEVELNVPAYIVPPEERMPVLAPKQVMSGAEQEAAKSFLAGGLEYSFPYGTQEQGFYSLTADHSSFANLHSQFVAALVAADLVEPFFFRAMTNLEYVTPPFEEISETLINDVAEAIRVHAQGTAVKAAGDTRQAISAPAQDLFTGVPIAALRKLVGEDQALLDRVNQLKNQFDSKVYYQQSSGFHPSELPGLFTDEANQMLKLEKRAMALKSLDLAPGQYVANKEAVDHAQGQIQDNQVAAARPRLFAVAKLLQNSVALAGAITFPETVPEPMKNPIKGFLTLVGQYAIAAQLERYAAYRGGTEKNLVSFLSRTALESAREALPAGFEEHLASTWLDNSEDFVAGALERSNAIVAVTNWADPSEPKEVLGPNPGAALAAIIAGNATQSVKPGSLLDVENAQQGGDVTTGEKLIPLEDRNLDYKLPPAADSANAVAVVLKDRWKRVMNRRLPILDEDYRTSIQVGPVESLEMAKIFNMYSYYDPEGSETVVIELDLFNPVLDNPSLIAVDQIFQLLAGNIPNLAQLRENVNTAEGEDAKLAAVRAFMVNWLDTKLRAAIQASVASANESREDIHKNVTQEIGDLECEITNSNNWEPVLTPIDDDWVVTYRKQPVLLVNGNGFAHYSNGEMLCRLKKCEGGQLKKLRFASLSEDEFVWENEIVID